MNEHICYIKAAKIKQYENKVHVAAYLWIQRGVKPHKLNFYINGHVKSAFTFH